MSTSAVGPYLGEVLKLLRAKGGEASVSSFVFLQACGVLFEDKGVPLDGETMQDTMHFLGELLKQLDHEERAAQAEDVYSPTLVEDLFGVDVATKVRNDFTVSHNIRC